MADETVPETQDSRQDLPFSVRLFKRSAGGDIYDVRMLSIRFATRA